MGIKDFGYATRVVPQLLEPLPGGTKLLNGIEFLVSWARANSLWPLIYGTACCAMEMMSTGSSRHDWARFGVEVARATPRQADLIVLAGTIVEKMGPRLVTLYEQMPGPKYVIAMGSCSISGGPFYYDSYSVVKGGDRLIPVDVYIPGCPPRPEALLQGIMELQKKIRTEGRHNPWRVGEINRDAIVDPFRDALEEWERESTGGKVLIGRRPVAKKETAEQFHLVPPATIRPPHLNLETVTAVLAERFPEVVAAVLAATAVGPETEAGGQAGNNRAEEKAPEIIELPVAPERYLELLTFLRRAEALQLDFLLQVTAVDRRDRLEVVVMLLSTAHRNKILVRCPLEGENPELDSISHLYGGANWHEREVYDLFGVRFRNHPDLRRLFLEDDFPGHPLRKDFTDPERLLVRPY